jgi:hypothetical protein
MANANVVVALFWARKNMNHHIGGEDEIIYFGLIK